MQCQCSDTIKQKLTEKITTQLPEGHRDLEVEVGHYVFPFTKTGIDHRFAVPVKIRYQAPKKRGDGFANKKEDTSILASYCPFCGERAVADQAETEGA
ncbi:hypothetical protein L861_09070 [Litchfieldella anticariensis FP35 = DSM 16096]|uniref:Uncharacterized protein n=1 Tax=Litchfieldella anticariensis (strain DSM 16096 / CECT 5854 / CIP 108499 / LMG 22089 / FP35) TaxID=1121939 RepID=S2LCL6_LITA3|nr:hypothetical protein [Halomonas anticariensis]EPC02491.1 hypothetical protein L861_09070 [Halomonas anticariensis FP35 = DSM 16096]